jgi:ribonuclease BN (tRNA processing enzyme)
MSTGLDLTILGCTGSYPGPGTACSGYLVRGGGEVVLVDAGPGTVANLQRHADLGDLTGVVLSHHHPDHWSDLGVLRTAWRYGLGREHLRVVGTETTHDLAVHLAGHDLAPTFDWTTTHDGAVVELGELRLTFSRTEHYVETFAIRIDHGDRSIAYSADTGPAWTFDALGSGIDVALCEATLLDDERAGVDEVILHLSAGEAARMAKACGIPRLLLTHLPPGADREAYRVEAEAAFGDGVEVVSEGASYTV